jgi:hypothetical protein
MPGFIIQFLLPFLFFGCKVLIEKYCSKNIVSRYFEVRLTPAVFEYPHILTLFILPYPRGLWIHLSIPYGILRFDSIHIGFIFF